MLRTDVHGDAIAMAGRGVDDGFVQTGLAHQLLLLDAVLIGELLKVKVVQQADDAPELSLVAIAQLLCEILHHTGNDLCVLEVEGVGIVLFQKRRCFLLCRNHKEHSFANEIIPL